MTPAPGKYMGEIVEVPAILRFDARKIDRYLCETTGGYYRASSVRQHAGRLPKPKYQFETSKKKHLLRRRPSDILPKFANVVFRKSGVLRVAGLPAPERLIVCAERTASGRMLAILKRLADGALLECTISDRITRERAQSCRLTNEAFTKSHSFGYLERGRSGFGRLGHFFARQTVRWSNQLGVPCKASVSEIEKRIARQPHAIPQDNGVKRVVDGDCSVRIILTHPTEPRVVSFVDRDCSTKDYPMGELMYHMMEWCRPMGIDARGTLANKDLVALQPPSRAWLVLCRAIRLPTHMGRGKKFECVRWLLPHGRRRNERALGR